MVTERWKGDDLVEVFEPKDDPRIEDYRCPHDVALIASLESSVARLRTELETVKGERDALQNEFDAVGVALRDLHWMARRYADGRRSYAPGLFNEHTKTLLMLNIALDGSEGLFARDADEQAAPAEGQKGETE